MWGARAAQSTVSSTGRPSATQPFVNLAPPRVGLARTARACCWRPHAGRYGECTDGVSRGSRLAVYAEGGSSQVFRPCIPKAARCRPR